MSTSGVPGCVTRAGRGRRGPRARRVGRGRGKAELDDAGVDVLKKTARREVAVFRGELPADARPVAVSADEVAGFAWLTAAG